MLKLGLFLMAFLTVGFHTVISSAQSPLQSFAGFKPRQSLPLSSYGIWTTSADFNGDGRADLAVGSNSANQLATFYGTGGGLVAGPLVNATDLPTRLCSGDFNRDGRADLVYFDTKVEVRFGQANSTFSSPQALTGIGIFPDGRLSLADVNADGYLDVLATNTTSTVGRGYVSIGYGDGLGGFQSISASPTGTNPLGIAVADLNRDGRPDIILGDEFGGVRVLYQGTQGSFATQKSFDSDRGYQLVTGDFNGDHIPDIALPAWNSNSIGVMLGQANGDLGLARYFPATGSPDSISAGDFNRDGVLDLVVSSQNGNGVTALLGAGDGTFGSATNLQASYNGSSTVTVGDFDDNGFDDIAVAAAGGQQLDVFYNASVSVPEPSLIFIGSFALIALTYRSERYRRSKSL